MLLYIQYVYCLILIININIMPNTEYQIIYCNIIIDRQYTKREHEDMLNTYNTIYPGQLKTKIINLC